MERKVLIYRNHLLRPSETFIRTQAEALEKFDFFYTGFQSVAKPDLSFKDTLTVRNGFPEQPVRELIYKLSSRHQSFFKEVEKKSPSLIHAHFGPDGVKAIPLASYLKIPLIVTFHGYDVTQNPYHVWHSSYSYCMYLLKRRRLGKAVSQFIAVSKFIKKKMIQRGFPENKIKVHYIGVDTSKFAPCLHTNRKPIVLFVGRLIEVKGCEFLIKAMARVQSLVPDAELVVLGDGPLRTPLERLASKTLINYQFLGFQSPATVQKWMSLSKVFCVPSVSAKSGHTEAFGTVFLEAQSMGLPVVSTLSGGIPEAVNNYETGFLVPERESNSLAESILRLLVSDTLWHQMSRMAVARAKSKFDIKKQTKILEGIYSNVVEESLHGGVRGLK